MVVVANKGLKLPLLRVRFERLAFAAGARNTVNVYVFVVTASCAVTAIAIILLPAARLIGADMAPLKMLTPFTVKVALLSIVVGLIVIYPVVLLTLAV